MICFELHICLLTITLLIRTEFLKKIKTCYKTLYIQNKIKMTHLAAQLPGDPSHPRPHSSSCGSAARGPFTPSSTLFFLRI